MLGGRAAGTTSASAWSSIAATSPIAGTATCGSGTASLTHARQPAAARSRSLRRSPGARGARCSSTSRRPGLSGGAGTVAFLVGCGYFDLGAFQVRQFLLTSYCGRARAARRRRRVLRRRRSDRHLQRQDVRRAGDGDALAVPPDGDAARRRAAFRHAAPGAAAVEAHGADRSRREGGCRLSTLERALFDVRRVGDVPASRSRRASSSSCAAAIRVRSSRCSSTTGSISCRWRRSRRARCAWRSEGADACRDWRGGAGARPHLRARRARRPRRGVLRRAPRRSRRATECQTCGEALYRLGAAAPARPPVRRGGATAGAKSSTLTEPRAARRHATAGGARGSSPSRRSRSITSIASATCETRVSWRCLRWRKLEEAEQPAAAPKACATGSRGSSERSAKKQDAQTHAELSVRTLSSCELSVDRATPWRRPAASWPSRPPCGSRRSARRTAW